MKQRLRPEVRRDQILAAALNIAEKRGYKRFTRDDVANGAGCSAGLVTRYFTTMLQLRRAVMREAILKRRLKIVAQGIADRNPYAMRAPLDLRNAAIATFSS